MANPTPSSSGESDESYLRRLRNFVEDNPNFSPESVAANGSSLAYRCTKFPIWDDDPNFSVTVNGVAQTLVSREALNGANQVAVDYENGWFYWNTAPTANGTVIVNKSSVRWRNERMLEALYSGLRATFPALWQDQTDTSLTTQVNVWEYTLPPIFYDPRVEIQDVQVQDIPYQLNQFRTVSWHRYGQNILHLPMSQVWTPGSQIRVRYRGPYQSLAELETQAQQLPLLYAKGVLLSNKELVRARLDTANVTQDQNANPVGTSQNAGAFFFQLFQTELDRLKRVWPKAPITSTYSRIAV